MKLKLIEEEIILFMPMSLAEKKFKGVVMIADVDAN